MKPGDLIKIISKITSEFQIGICINPNIVKRYTHVGSYKGVQILTPEGISTFPISHWYFEVL